MRAVLAGALAGLCYTLSPLLVWSLLALLATAWVGARPLVLRERQFFLLIFAGGVAVRAVVVAAIAIRAIPELNDLAVGTLGGDEGYNLARSLRARDLMLGFGDSRYDYFVVNDEYGRSSYLTLIAWLQMLAGPSPFGLRLINIALFMAAATVLHRLVRSAYGVEVALLAFSAVVFLPTLLLASIAILKESLYFLLVAVFLTAAWRATRADTLQARLGAAAIVVVSLYALNDLRRGAMLLGAGVLIAALAIRVIFISRRRVVVAAVVALTLVATAVINPNARGRVARQVEQLAKVHAGNVFTIGRPYKLLDDGFYMNPRSPASTINLTFEQGARFLTSAAAAFVLVPSPWQSQTRSDLVYLPQQLLWYAAIILSAVGLIAGWRRDPMLTSLLAAHLAITSAALMFTNGNIGTLVRLRGLVWPYLLCIAAAGAMALLSAALTRTSRAGLQTGVGSAAR